MITFFSYYCNDIKYSLLTFLRIFLNELTVVLNEAPSNVNYP